MLVIFSFGLKQEATERYGFCVEVSLNCNTNLSYELMTDRSVIYFGQRNDTAMRKKNWLFGVIQLAFVILVLAMAFLIVAVLGRVQDTRQPLSQEVAQHDAISVSVELPRPGTFTPHVKLNGVVEAQAEISISAQVGGRVIEVSPSLRPGGEIRKGELLFRIDPSDYRLSVQSAEAEIASAQSSLAQAETDAQLALEEWELLYPDEPISDLAARIPQLEAAKARLQAAQSAKQQAELSLNRTRVIAEQDIRILTSRLTVGQLVGTNQSVGTAFPINSIEISAPASLAEIAVIKPVTGRTAQIESASVPGDVSQGTIVRQDAALDGRTRLSTLYIQPDDTDEIAVGTFVNVLVDGEAVPDALYLPKTAFTKQNQVWVVANGQLQSRTVIRLGQTEDQIVVQSFDIGEGVVVNPPNDAMSGTAAKIRQDEEEG